MRFLTASHCSISYLSPPLGGTFTRARIEFTDTPEPRYLVVHVIRIQTGGRYCDDAHHTGAFTS